MLPTKFMSTALKPTAFISKALVLCLALVIGNSAWALNAQVDRSQLSADESLTLVLSVDSAGASGRPDFRPLENDFEILASRSSSSTNIVNFKMTSRTEWILTLLPKRAGRLEIPAIEFNGERSEPIPVHVTPESAPTYSGKEATFIETSLSSESVYVQERIDYRLRFYTAVSIGNIELTPLKIDNALVHKLEPVQYSKRVGGRDYRVVEWRWAIHPQASGELTIPGQSLSATVQDQHRYSMFGRGKPVIKRVREQSLMVKPPASGFSGNTWLPAKSLRLHDSFSGDPGTLKVGDSITRRITIESDELLGSQLPPLAKQDVRGLKQYPDKTHSEDKLAGQELIGIRQEGMALIPTQPGTITLPTIRIPWWNTDSDRLEWAELPERHLQVAAAPNQSGQTKNQNAASTANGPSLALSPLSTADSDDASSTNGEQKESDTEKTESDDSGTLATASLPQSLWQWLSLAFGITTLLCAIGWWRASRAPKEAQAETKTAAPPSISEAEKATRKALKAAQKSPSPQTLNALREHLLRWTSLVRGSRLNALSDIAQWLPNTAPAMQALDAALFNGDNAQLDIAALEAAIASIAKRQKSRQAHKALGDLYPAS